MDIELLSLKRATIKSKIETNLNETNVIMAQKRRLFLNALKVLNYNSEKWLQKIFQKHYSKEDEILSLIRNLFKQPCKIRENERLMEVVLDPMSSAAMSKAVETILKKLSKTNDLRLPDGKILRIKMTH